MLKNYFKIAWRNLLWQRKTTLINLFGLVAGLTGALFILMWVQNEYRFDQYHPTAERIYRLTSFNRTNQKSNFFTPYLTGEKFKVQFPIVENFARIRPITGFTPSIQVENEVFKEKHAAYVDEQWFNLFSYTFIAGNAYAFDQPDHVVIAESLALKYFGTTDAVGRIIMADSIQYTIQGIFKDAPTNSSFPYDLFFPVATRHTEAFWRNRDSRIDLNAYQTFIRVAETKGIDRLASKMQKGMPQNWQGNFRLILRPLKDIHFENDLDWSDTPRGNEKMVNACLLLGTLLLLICCFNYINLTTANASRYLKSISVRKIIGANRKQLFWQFIIESAIVSTTAFLGAMLLANLLLPWFNQLVDNHFSLSFRHTALWRLFAVTWFFSIAANSIYPAVLLSSFNLSSFFNKNSRLRGSASLRKILIVFQFSASFILIVGTIVLYEQMHFINQQYMGYDQNRIFSFTIPNLENTNTLKAYFKQALLKESSIERVSLGSSLIKVDNPWGPFDWDGRNPDIKYPISFVGADADFRSLFGLQLIKGRWFHQGGADEKNFVLNETAVKTLGIRKPVIGQRFASDQESGVIVGLVKDIPFQGMHEKITPLVFSNNLQYTNTLLVESATGKQDEARRVTEKLFKTVTPHIAFDYQFVKEEFDHLYQKEYLSTTLVSVFASLAILISCLGLYGLVTFSAEQRNKEIGIRKVLGASVAGVVVLLSRDFMKLVGMALLISAPIAWWLMQEWLADFAYKISLHWWMFIAAGGVAVFIALITTAIETVKAALANPVKSLRNE